MTAIKLIPKTKPRLKKKSLILKPLCFLKSKYRYHLVSFVKLQIKKKYGIERVGRYSVYRLRDKAVYNH